MTPILVFFGRHVEQLGIVGVKDTFGCLLKHIQSRLLIVVTVLREIVRVIRVMIGRQQPNIVPASFLCPARQLLNRRSGHYHEVKPVVA